MLLDNSGRADVTADGRESNERADAVGLARRQCAEQRLSVAAQALLSSHDGVGTGAPYHHRHTPVPIVRQNSEASLCSTKFSLFLQMFDLFIENFTTVQTPN